MSVISTMVEGWELNRHQTLRLLDAIEALPNPEHVLGWRPAPGRAHIAWQLMHIGISEEVFATEDLLGQAPDFAEYVLRFKSGSTPDEEIPSPARIREVLNSSREHLVRTVSTFSDRDLETIPEAYRERGWSFAKFLRIVAWHEAHHQGQAHLTLNMYRAAHPESATNG